MRVLVVADVESKYYYDYYAPGKLDEFDLIIACGDLDRNYLEFLVTLAHCPLLYVRGNHDSSYDEQPPEGCICIDDQIFEYQGVRFLGLGGSYKYKSHGSCMYTERQMRNRIARLWFSFVKYKGFDVLVTHAPAAGLGDLDDLAHKGFKCFVRLIEKYRPRYHIHGHVHRNYGMKIPRTSYHEETIIINAFEHYKFNY